MREVQKPQSQVRVQDRDGPLQTLLKRRSRVPDSWAKEETSTPVCSHRWHSVFALMPDLFRKREYLLNQIREQAEEINSLMARLDELQRHSTEPTSQTDAANIRIIDEWLSTARQSFQLFDGGIPRRLIVEHDLEDSPTSGEDESEGGQVDPRSIPTQEGSQEIPEGSRQKTVRKHSSTSSFGSHSGSGRRQAEKPLGLPSEAVPIGLMAGMSLRKVRETGDDDVDDESSLHSGVGVANDDFFRPSVCAFLCS
jgi:hypothetical protein